MEQMNTQGETNSVALFSLFLFFKMLLVAETTMYG
jgi:hypothetical protein